MKRFKVLVVDDDADLRRLLGLHLGQAGYDTAEADTVADGCAAFDRHEPDIVLADLNLPDASGLAVVDHVRASGEPASVIVITGEGTIEKAVQALQRGADNFVTKPLDLDVLLALLHKGQEAIALRRHVVAETAGGSAHALLARTKSPALARIVEALPRLARSDGNVLIGGESGTGKGLVARSLHELSGRAGAAFVELNCSALSRELLESELFGHAAGAFTGAARAKPGLIEVADEGTLFLDEIGDMDLAVQPKLLKVIEDQRIRRLGSVSEKQVDVRVVAASHFDLAARSRSGQFRHDLFYRLDVLRVDLPPLRERREDIADLARAFLAARGGGRAGNATGFAPASLAWLESGDFPGNVRELRNLVERAAVHAGAGAILPEHFGVRAQREAMASAGGPPSAPVAHLAAAPAPPAPADAPAAPAGDALPADALTLEAVERAHVARVVARSGGNRSEAARVLGVTRQTLLRKVRQYGLE